MSNYLIKILKLQAAGKIPKGGIHNLQIAHDNDCSYLKGKGHCDCDPDITVMEEKDFN